MIATARGCKSERRVRSIVVRLTKMIPQRRAFRRAPKVVRDVVEHST